MDRESYIGKAVKGFKFETRDHNSYVLSMDRHIGEVGKIKSYNKRGDSYHVEFANDWWSYPADEVIKRIGRRLH